MAEHQVMSCLHSHNSYTNDFVSHQAFVRWGGTPAGSSPAGPGPLPGPRRGTGMTRTQGRQDSPTPTRGLGRDHIRRPADRRAGMRRHDDRLPWATDWACAHLTPGFRRRQEPQRGTSRGSWRSPASPCWVAGDRTRRPRRPGARPPPPTGAPPHRRALKVPFRCHIRSRGVLFDQEHSRDTAFEPSAYVRFLMCPPPRATAQKTL